MAAGRGHVDLVDLLIEYEPQVALILYLLSISKTWISASDKRCIIGVLGSIDGTIASIDIWTFIGRGSVAEERCASGRA